MGDEFQEQREQWRGTLKEQDELIEAKKNEYQTAIDQYGPNSKEADIASKEYRAAVDHKHEVREEMSNNSRAATEAARNEYGEASKIYGTDSKEANEAYVKYEKSRREGEELEKDLRQERTRGI